MLEELCRSKYLPAWGLGRSCLWKRYAMITHVTLWMIRLHWMSALFVNDHKSCIDVALPPVAEHGIQW